MGFFEVDMLSGAIQTKAGLIMPDAGEAYRTAALDRAAPLTRLDGYHKEVRFGATFKANQHYAAMVISEVGNGNTRAIYSLVGANPSQSIQMLSFDRGYYGFEDLVKGQDAGWDGDFNDITFYLT
jgi:hypothetical protein